MRLYHADIAQYSLPVVRCNTLIIGSGAASLNAAVHLYDSGVTDLVIATERLGGGTSSNSGSDKQTYYKVSLAGDTPDSPYDMARTLFGGGCMHGDIALVEATVSPQEFFHLVAIGVPFPHDRNGGYVGYKTDHDPRARAASAGPWTSNQMVSQLLKEVRRREIPILDSHEVIAILTRTSAGEVEAIGALAIDKNRVAHGGFGLVLMQSANVIMGTGGPGGIYKSSVYPEGHLGSTGIALEAGASAANLTEWQYGLASTAFRWNVSGTYQQVVPRYFSTAQDGSDERDFLNDYFEDMGTLATDIFLKGYQWPFDPRKIENMGSSIIDVLVYIESVVRGRRVYMDFTRNPSGSGRLEEFRLECLSQEALTYLTRSNALLERPIDRLKKMNPMAVELYVQHGIDITAEPLEIAVCAQHNNGGLVANEWWESDVRHLFPVGEVNGTHGVYRPGGSALNSGQVGGYRAAQFIANRYSGTDDLGDEEFIDLVEAQVARRIDYLHTLMRERTGGRSWREFREAMQARMSCCAAHVREPSEIGAAAAEARRDWAELEDGRIRADGADDIVPILQNRQLCLTHIAVLRSIQAYLANGGGSRGSYLVLDRDGRRFPVDLGDPWRYRPEKADLRSLVLEVKYDGQGDFVTKWVPVRPIPKDDSWFENVWADYIEKEVFRSRR
jgi:succinate dehydrogenase/fumarate reductase flavoprotein subunit